MARDSEERFRLTFEQAAVGMAHLSVDGRWLEVNDKLCELLGYDREELLESTVQDLTHHEDLEGDAVQFGKLLSGETETYSAEKRYLRKDGSVLWVNFAGSLVRAPTGEYLTAVIEDVSESKQAQEALRLLERAVTASTNSILITDPNQPDDPIVYVNPAFEKTTGYSAEEVLGRNCRFLQGGDRGQPALEDLRAAVREGRYCTAVLRNYRKDGTLFWNELSIYPVRDDSGRIANFVGVQNDITERRRTEEALSEIRRAERRRIARDLHDMVLQDLAGTLQSLRLTNLRARTSGVGLDLAEELAALGRATSGLRSAIYDLRHEKERSFVESVEALVELNRQATPERTVRLVGEEGFPRELPEPVGTELLRVLQEALANARRHSGARNIEVKLRIEGGEILAEITDDGRGFDLASVRSGVGLSAMRERIEGVGGKIGINSRPGEGTKLTLKLGLGDGTPAPRGL